MSAALAVTMLQYFGVVQDGAPISIVRRLSPYIKIAVIVGFVVFCIRGFAKRKKPNGGI